MSNLAKTFRDLHNPSGLESRLPAMMNPADRKTAAMAIFAMLVGVVQLSRATKGTKLSEEMIEAALRGARALMGK